jgi:hypothetical protein
MKVPVALREAEQSEKHASAAVRAAEIWNKADLASPRGNWMGTDQDRSR